MKRMKLLWSLGALLPMLLSACAAPATPLAATQIPAQIEVTRIVQVQGTPQVVTQVVTQQVTQQVEVTPTPPPKGGDTLTFRLALDPESLDNAQTTSGDAESVFATFIVERLVYVDEDGKTHPWLAKSWDISPDNLQVTFHLQQGVKFTDGTDFNADAVKFQFDRIMDKATASPALAYIPTLKSVDVVDNSTVKFTFDKPDAGFWTVITYGYFGFNSPTAVKAGGDQYGRHPVGSGPYMLDNWTPGSQIVLVRNPNYKQLRDDAINKGAPLADKVILKVIAEEGTAQAALQTGEILVAQFAATWCRSSWATHASRSR